MVQTFSNILMGPKSAKSNPPAMMYLYNFSQNHLSIQVTECRWKAMPMPTRTLTVLGQVLSKFIHSFWIQGAEKIFSNILSVCVTLKVGSRSPKSNRFLSMSQKYICASLVKIHPFLQGTVQTFSNILMGPRSPKSNQLCSKPWCICIT